MKILEYSQVDPLKVLHLNLLCLGISLTLEQAETIRYEDPRAFPFFCIYGQVDDNLAGQAGVFRLPVMSIEKADEVGGLWAVSIHPSFSRQQIAHQLLEEAHERMRAAGLSFSTVVTNRHQVSHEFYRKLGYEDVFSSPSAIARLVTLPANTGLRAEQAGRDRLPLADHLFEQIANSYLGFARRHKPFFPYLHRREYLNGQDLWLLWKDNEPVGYAAVSLSNSILRIANLLLFDWIDPVVAVAAVARKVGSLYVQVTVDRLTDTKSFIEAGFRLANAGWGTFMVKPLAMGITVEDFRRLYGLDTDHFLISYMDVN
jgi:GNAT superfamily N-acetyltransferase